MSIAHANTSHRKLEPHSGVIDQSRARQGRAFAGEIRKISRELNDLADKETWWTEACVGQQSSTMTAGRERDLPGTRVLLNPMRKLKVPARYSLVPLRPPTSWSPEALAVPHLDVLGRIVAQ